MESLQNDGYQCEEDYYCSRSELAEKIKDYTGLVIRSRFVLDREILEKAKALQFIARSGSGMENIDTEYASNNGIQCFNSPEGNRDAVGEHAIGMLLSLLNKLNTADLEVRQGNWRREENRGIEIGGKVVGIIGYGNTGSAMAKKLSGFDCMVLAYDKYKSGFGGEFAKECDIKEIFQEADIVSVHIPLNEENQYFINEDFFSGFEKDIYFINTSRGPVLKTSALVSAIERGKVKGACLDVLEYELKSFGQLSFNEMPRDFQYLIQSDKTLLSPHVAGWTKESYEKLSAILYEKIRDNISL